MTSTPRLPVWRRTAWPDVFPRVVDDQLGAGPARAFGLFRSRGRRQDARSGEQSDLHRRPRHTSADPVDQDRLAGADGRAPHDHPPGRLVSERKGGRLRHREAFRYGKDVAGRNDDRLREGSGQLLSQDAEGHAETLFPGPAEFAAPAPDAGLQEHPIAGSQTGDAFPERIHHPGTIAPGNLGKRHAGDAVAHEDVQAIECRRPNRHAHLPGAGNGGRPLGVLQDVVRAVLGEEDGLHFRYPNDLSFSRYSRSVDAGEAPGAARRGP